MIVTSLPVALPIPHSTLLFATLSFSLAPDPPRKCVYLVHYIHQFEHMRPLKSVVELHRRLMYAVRIGPRRPIEIDDSPDDCSALSSFYVTTA